MITFEDILEYEASNLSLIQSYWYKWFTKSFVKKCKKKYDLYKTWMSHKYLTNIQSFINSQKTNNYNEQRD